MPIERKLAAIMFTDIAGYTALSAKDETKALKLLDTQKQILTPIIKEFNGTLHKEMGDALLYTFPTVSEAVKCGIKIQEQTKDTNDLNLRIGIHEGEVTLKDGDVLGDDVNVASRIEPFSAVGGIAISGKIQQNISSLIEFETKYIGKPKLKGVAQKVEVYCITSHGLPETNLSKVSAKLEEEESKFNIFALTGGILTAIGIAFWIAVGLFDISFGQDDEVPSVVIFPFENKGEKKDEFYAYSISLDVISDITNAGMIRVASYNQIKDIELLSNKEVSKELDIRYIVTGSLWKMEKIFQLSMEIFDTRASKVIYLERFEKKWKDLSSIKGVLSKIIASKLSVNSIQKFSDTPTTNNESYQLYLNAKYKFDNSQSNQDTIDSRSLVKKAIELDEDNIEAILWLSTTYDIDNYKEDYQIALDYGKKALDLAQLSNKKHLIGKAFKNLGKISLSYGKLMESLKYYKNSISYFLNVEDKHNESHSFSQIGKIYNRINEVDSSIAYYEKSIVIENQLGDKRSLEFISNVYRNLGMRYSDKDDYLTAILYFKKLSLLSDIMQDKRHMILSYRILGRLYDRINDYDKSYDSYMIYFGLLKNVEDFSITELFAILNMGFFLEEIGRFEKSIDCFNILKKELKVFESKNAEKIRGNRNMVKSIEIIKSRCLTRIGYSFFVKQEYKNAEKYFTDSQNMRKHLGNTILLSLNEKKLYDNFNYYAIKDELLSYKKELDYEEKFNLYKLLEDSSYLETAYNQVQEKASAIEEKLAAKFLSYPIPKAIVKEYNKVFKK